MLKVLIFEDDGILQSIKWKSKTNQLLISGGNNTVERYFLLYNYNNNSYTDLVGITQGVVIDMAFSPDDSHLYFI